MVRFIYKPELLYDYEHDTFIIDELLHIYNSDLCYIIRTMLCYVLLQNIPNELLLGDLHYN